MRKFKALKLFLRFHNADMHELVIQGLADLPVLRIVLSKASPFFTVQSLKKSASFYRNNTFFCLYIIYACELYQNIADAGAKKSRNGETKCMKRDGKDY
jgi:hypothetical protein